MKVLVCGDRNWSDYDLLAQELDTLHKANGFTLVIEGGANGADTLARRWAVNHGIRFREVAADWNRYGKAAGPLRNREMLDYSPELVVAFHDDLGKSKGTRNMVKLAQLAGVKVLVVGHGDEVA